MVRPFLAFACALCLAGCDTRVGGPPIVTFGGPALVSGMSPPAPLASRAEPQTVNSLPPGAEGIGKSPIATAPNEGSVTIALPR